MEVEEEEEHWVPINGFPRYMISDWGNIMNLHRPSRYVRLQLSARGRKYVTLNTESGTKTRWYDELLVEHFG
jgi:hypothetical protein